MARENEREVQDGESRGTFNARLMTSILGSQGGCGQRENSLGF